LWKQGSLEEVKMKKVLDVGCGTGNLLNYLAKRKKQSLFWGVDVEKEIIERAEKNKFSNRETFKVTDAKKLPFEDNFFDEVYCHEVLEHVGDLDETLNEIKRILKSKGKFRITVPIKESEMILIKYNKEYPAQVGHRRFFSKEKIQRVLREKGFKIKFYETSNSIEHIFWKNIFKRGGKIINQLGEVDKRPSKIMRVSSLALSRDIFYNKDQTKNKYYKFIMNFFILSYPIIFLLDLILLNKKQKIICTNEK
jgi:ubiquinone/menaquinone biosynthesis C-methylase UbiE